MSESGKKFNKYEKHGAYHWVQYEKNTKYTRHADRVKAWIKEVPVLDIGAGDGKITHMLGATGVDDDSTGVKLAQEHGARVFLGDAYSLAFPDGSFQAIFMGDVLEHFEFPKKALQEARRVLQERGFLYLAVPEKGTNNDPFHYQEWTPEELQPFVEEEGFSLAEPMLLVSQDKRLYAKFQKV